MFYSYRYKSTTLQKHKDDNITLKILNEALGLAEKVSLMTDGSFSWFDSSPSKHYQRCEGHQLLVWGGRGYKTILEILLKNTTSFKDKLFLNEKVDNIYWNGDKVTVNTSKTSYKTDYVIFTPSVGVLKDQKDSLFNPRLPENKLKAIEAIGIAGVGKIIMHFETKWWLDDDVIFSFIWDAQETGETFEYGPKKNGTSWISAIAAVAVVPGNPRVLTAWVTTDFVPLIEDTPLNVLKEGCFYFLKKFLGKSYNVTAPDYILR